MERLLFDNPVATKYVDLAGIERDLELVVEACNYFLSMPSVGSNDAIVLSRALGAYAVMTYGRTFVDGIREPIPLSLINRLSPELRAAHERFKEQRHKFFAHSSSTAEDGYLEVEVAAQVNGDLVLESLSTVHSRPATHSTEDILLLRRLAEEVLRSVESESELEHRKVWEHLEALCQEDFRAALSPLLKRGVREYSGHDRKRYGHQSGRRGGRARHRKGV